MNVHWRVKLASKLMLARLPVSYEGWRRLSLFRLGQMDDPSYVISVFERHFQRSGLAGKRGFAVLELGPGDSVASAIVASAHGAAKSYLVDVGPYATLETETYRSLARLLDETGHGVPDLTGVSSVHEMLGVVNGEYLTEGLASLRSIPSSSIDFVWSHAVLEHVLRGEFSDTIDELCRVLKPGAVMSHRIDFQDHLSESLNNLRFSDKRWESTLFQESGFYTNRLLRSDVEAEFHRADMCFRCLSVDRWDRLPIPRARLAKPFRDHPEEDLLTRGYDIVARHCE